MSRSTPENERILHYYEEDPSPAYRRKLLAEPEERAAYERLAADLDRIREADPAAPAGSDEADGAETATADRVRADRLWEALAPKLTAARPGRRRPPRRAAWVAAAAASLALAFLAGTWFGGGAAGETIPAEARERLLHAMVDEHLRRSERLLTDLVHADPAAADWEPERARAERLAATNRLYRGTLAVPGADARLLALLDDLERVLVEVANASADAGAAERMQIRRRIQRLGLRARLRLQEQRPQPAPATTTAAGLDRV